jgi:hypothetical protein
MPATYEPIATTTLGSAASVITFSSIASSWTDLRLVLTATMASSGGAIYLQFNSDTGSNYSSTSLEGRGTTANSQRLSNRTKIELEGFWFAAATTTPFLQTLDIFSYAGSTNKTVLTTASNDQNGSGEVLRTVGLWRDTSAINRIDITAGSPNFAIGTTATLYGIKNF